MIHHDSSIVSLREITIFSKCLGFFKNYLTIKNKYEKRVNNEKITNYEALYALFIYAIMLN